MTVFSAWPRHNLMQRWERGLGQRVTSQSPANHTGRGDNSQEHTNSKDQCQDEGLRLGKTGSGGELVTRGNWEGHEQRGHGDLKKILNSQWPQKTCFTSNKTRALHQPVSIITGKMPLPVHATAILWWEGQKAKFSHKWQVMKWKL